MFDLNDFDETLPGPFEWDVKRMAASFVVAARDNGFTPADGRAAALASVAAYREAMAEFARQGTMDIWYASLDEDKIKAAVLEAGKTATKSKATGGGQAKMAKLAQKRVWEAAAKAHTRDSLQALSKLGELDDGRYRIVNQPPVVIPVRDLAPELTPRPPQQADPRAVHGLPREFAARHAAPAGALRGRGLRPQGRRRRQRGHPLLHRPAPRPRR